MILFALVPLGLIGLYMVILWMGGFDKIDKRIIQKFYYLLALIWLVVYISTNYQKINARTIISIEAIDSSVLNYIIIVVSWYIGVWLIDYWFISCKKITSFKVKDVEITVDENEKIEIYKDVNENEVKALYNVLKTKQLVIKFIDKTLGNDDEIDVEKVKILYQDVFNQYNKARDKIDLYVFWETDNFQNDMLKDIDISGQELGSIMFSIHYVGYCVFENSKRNIVLFSRIETKYTENNIIFALKGDDIINEEHLVLIELINYLELKIDFIVKQ